MQGNSQEWTVPLVPICLIEYVSQGNDKNNNLKVICTSGLRGLS